MNNNTNKLSDLADKLPDELTVERSTEAAIVIGQINQLVSLVLDGEYLKECLKQMRENHSIRNSASILAPNQFCFYAKNDLQAVKLKQLDLLVKLYDNAQEIIKAEIEVGKVLGNERKLNDFFGF